MAKKRTKSPPPPKNPSIMATNERARHDGGVLIETINESALSTRFIRRHRARFESVLDGYRWHGAISQAEAEAGKKFHREYARAVLRVQIEDNGAGCHGDFEMRPLSAINGNQVLCEAYKLLSVKQRELVISVCGENCYAGGTRRIKYLAQALACLAKHWNML